MLHVHHCHLTLGGATGAKSSFKPLEVEDASQKVDSLRQFRARRGVQVGGLWEVQARKSKAKEPPGQISHFHPHCTCQAAGVSRTGEKGITIPRITKDMHTYCRVDLTPFPPR